MNISETEYAPFYHTYVQTVGEDVFAALSQQLLSIPEFIKAIPTQKEDYAYAPGKWTVKEVFGHIIDTERIMAYRALRIARADETPLAGFEENDYAAQSHYHERSMESLSAEFELLRKSNMFLFESFNDEELRRTGTASGKNVSVRALLFIVAGHINHHKRILEERYL
ncbi:MAG: DinB family protein [Taibaiella sp.]|jgi:hypothetical protein